MRACVRSALCISLLSSVLCACTDERFPSVAPGAPPHHPPAWDRDGEVHPDLDLDSGAMTEMDATASPLDAMSGDDAGADAGGSSEDADVPGEVTDAGGDAGDESAGEAGCLSSDAALGAHDAMATELCRGPTVTGVPVLEGFAANEEHVFYFRFGGWEVCQHFPVLSLEVGGYSVGVVLVDGSLVATNTSASGASALALRKADGTLEEGPPLGFTPEQPVLVEAMDGDLLLGGIVAAPIDPAYAEYDGAPFVARFGRDLSLRWFHGFVGEVSRVANLHSGPDNGVFITLDFELLKLDSAGDERWRVQVQPPPETLTNAEPPVSITVVEDGTAFVSGWGGPSAYLTRVSSAGVRDWTRVVYAEGRAPLALTPDGLRLIIPGDSGAQVEPDDPMPSNTSLPYVIFTVMRFDLDGVARPPEEYVRYSPEWQHVAREMIGFRAFPSGRMIAVVSEIEEILHRTAFYQLSGAPIVSSECATAP